MCNNYVLPEGKKGKLLLHISEKQKGARNIAVNQLKRFFQWLWPTIHPVLIQGDW